MAFQFTGQKTQKLSCASSPSPFTMAIWKDVQGWLSKSCGLLGGMLTCMEYTRGNRYKVEFVI